MSSSNRGIRGCRLDQTPFAVIDFETTGLRPGPDRVVEVSVVRVEPGEPPRLVLDTLVNPTRPVTATDVHGISDDDVRGAPTFDDVAGLVARELAGCVVASYNVYFDMPFLRYELSRAGLAARVPHACVMWLRPLLGLGARCCLSDACRQHGIESGAAHAAAMDAMAAARLLRFCLGEAGKAGLLTFGDLAGRATYRFLESFDDGPLEPAVGARMTVRGTPKSRSTPAEATAPKPKATARAVYWDALLTALADLNVTDGEVELLRATRRDLALSDAETRSLHARAFAQAISQVNEDRQLDARECALLQRLSDCLRQVCWAPGDPCVWPTI